MIVSKILEARITRDFNNKEIIWGEIHSKFQKVFNIRFSLPFGRERLLTVNTLGLSGIPDSLTVLEETYQRLSLLPLGSKVCCKDFKFYFLDTEEALIGTCECHRQSNLLVGVESVIGEVTGLPNLIAFQEQLGILRDQGNYTDGFSIFPDRKKTEIEINLYHFIQSWLGGDREEMKAILLNYIGLGIGLTPSLDDAFLGIFAVLAGARLYAHSQTRIHRKYLQVWADMPGLEIVQPFDKLLNNRTTDVSLKYLCCAQEGNFSDLIIHMIRIMFSKQKENWEPIIVAASKIGNSSGMDMLYGASIAVAALQEKIK